MTDTNELQQRLRDLSRGFEEWRVQDPKDGSYCLSLTRDDCMSPEHECREWLAREKRERPDGMHSGYVVARHRVQTAKDKAMEEAADTIQRLQAENARLIEDRARFPDRPDDIGRMIGSRFSNLQAAAKASEGYALRAMAQASDDSRDAARYRFVRTADKIAISAQAARDPAAYDAAIDAAIDAARQEKA